MFKGHHMLQPGRFVACIFAVQKAAHNALSVSWPTCLPAVHAGAAVQSGAHDTAETAAGCRLSFHFCLQERHSKTTCRRLYQSTCLPAVPTGAAACRPPTTPLQSVFNRLPTCPPAGRRGSPEGGSRQAAGRCSRGHRPAGPAGGRQDSRPSQRSGGRTPGRAQGAVRS